MQNIEILYAMSRVLYKFEIAFQTYECTYKDTIRLFGNIILKLCTPCNNFEIILKILGSCAKLF